MSLQKIELLLDVELLPVRQLTIDNITCLYENGNLRYIRYGEEEVVRMIYASVRDQYWATAPYEIRDEVIDSSEEAFIISYTAFYQLNNIQYRAAIQIVGKENSISFSMQGEAMSDFLRNRIGICVHHPIKKCKGKNVRIIHPDKTESTAVFPEMISPHQPFKQVQKMQWEIGSAATAILEFEGDVFETEDQRNWTDHSYKTYSTPLELPFPVQVKKGETVTQNVNLLIAAKENSTGQFEHNAVTKLPVRLPFPKIGYERAQGSPHLTAADIERLRQIPFDHYRVMPYFSESNWKEELNTAASEAKQIGAQLELMVCFSSFSKEQLQELLEEIQDYSQHIMSLLLLKEGEVVTPQAILQKAYDTIKAGLPHVKVGYGTDGFFAELNRNRPEQNLPFDFLSYSINPQVHASDIRSLVENLEAQGDTIKAGQAFAPGKAIHVSPVTLKIRADKSSNLITPADEDNRLYTAFGAMWTLLAINNLAGADCITFCQAKSYRGVINDSIKGDDSPLYQLLKQLKSFCPKWIINDNTNSKTFLVENEQGEQLLFILQDPVIYPFLLPRNQERGG